LLKNKRPENAVKNQFGAVVIDSWHAMINYPSAWSEVIRLFG
jgi:hypothetical protein